MNQTIEVQRNTPRAYFQTANQPLGAPLASCEICDGPIPVRRKKLRTCGLPCLSKLRRRNQTGKVTALRETRPCVICGKLVTKRSGDIKTGQDFHCSKRCNGKDRAKELVAVSKKGHLGWSDESKKARSDRMCGERNPN